MVSRLELATRARIAAGVIVVILMIIMVYFGLKDLDNKHTMPAIGTANLISCTASKGAYECEFTVTVGKIKSKQFKAKSTFPMIDGQNVDVSYTPGDPSDMILGPPPRKKGEYFIATGVSMAAIAIFMTYMYYKNPDVVRYGAFGFMNKSEK